MFRAVFLTGSGAAAICAVMLAWPSPAPAQDAVAAQSELPDFSGLWVRTRPMPSTFEPPLSGPGPVTDPQDHTPDGVPWIGDTSNPILKPHAVAAIEARNEVVRSGEEDLPPHSLCWPSGIPQVLNLREPIQILQDEDQITILYQRDHQIRRVYLNVPHSENPEPSWYGESVGHYEGNTLVIDTIAQTIRTSVDKFDTPHSEQLHVVERYTFDPESGNIVVAFTVEDPETFNMAWSGRATYRSTEGVINEIICAENNKDAMTGKDYPIPVAATIDF